MRQTSPSLGGKERPSALANHSIPGQGKANSTDQPLSLSLLWLRVPSTCTAVCKPGKSHAHEPRRRPRGCVLKPTPLNGLTFGLERDNSGTLAKPPLS